MTIRMSMQRVGLKAARRIALVLVAVLIAGGCSKSEQMSVVRAVAAGISQANPFFEEDGRLGKDMRVPEARPSGGVQASNSPGLYGGATGGDATGEDSTGGGSTGGDDGSSGQGDDGGATGEFGGSTKPGTCDVAKLKDFLTDDKNSAKAAEWARVRNIGTGEIPGHIDRLTPVVLRHDTLVTNHEYEDGKAVPFDALLQAGIAILVDPQGLPAVKCSCGNPLLPYKGDAEKTSVRFTGGNKQWSGYRQDRIVVVEPPPGAHRVERLQLVDVHDPDRGINRPIGTAGEGDKSFDTHAELRVPAVTRTTFAAAAQRLADAGLVTSYDGDTPPADDSLVTASQPTAGSTLEWGAAVTLFVEGPAEDGGGGLTTPPDPDSGGVSTGPGGSSSAPGESSTGTGELSTAPGTPSPSPPSTGSSGTSAPGGGTDSSALERSPTPNPPPPSTSPPTTPTSEPAGPTKTQSLPAGPTSDGPTSDGPVSTGPTSTAPVPVPVPVPSDAPPASGAAS
ncbi:DUF6777 domain-containing protein [Streptomyces sp. NPDC127072]|uniref:DUF6777 domain-containing protein n=1 Tax=Streptomyces sp. NPDC127072 TaxID=3347129 RepID=UPI0036588905